MKGLQVLAVFLAALFLAAWGFQTCTDRLARFPGQTARDSATAIQDILASFKDVLGVTPRIQQNQTLVFEQVTPIEELAVLQRDFAFSYTMREEWLLGAKQLTARGTFRAKAGFDLTQPITILVDSHGRATADLPPAQILSVEPIGNLDFGEATAWLSRIKPEDRTRLKNELLARARAHAASGTLLSDAEAELQKRLIERLGPATAPNLEVRFRH